MTTHEYLSAAEQIMYAAEAQVYPTLGKLDVAQTEQIGLSATYILYRMSELGVTIPTLLASTTYPRQYIHRVLRGEKTLSDGVIRAIDKNTGISMAELFLVRALANMTKAHDDE